jgi:tetratricopeptide (TPR) repeat protein
MDVNGLSAGEFRSRLDGFKFPEAHLWMPGENLWMVIARKRPRAVKLDSVLELFSRESAFAGFAKYGVDSPAAVFAGYVGTVAEIRPAFSRGDLSATVRPEFFISRDDSGIGWLSAETMDADVSARVLSSITDAREIRRMVVEGAMKAAAGDENGAVEMWAQAEEWMGGDVFLRERLDRLERNAKGFLAVKKVLMAMKCYETMLRIRPGDAAAAYKFGMCLREIGKLDLAERVFERARELMRDGGSGGGSAGRE